MEPVVLRPQSRHRRRRDCSRWDDELGCGCLSAVAPPPPPPSPSLPVPVPMEAEAANAPLHRRRRDCRCWDEELGCKCSPSEAPPEPAGNVKAGLHRGEAGEAPAAAAGPQPGEAGGAPAATGDHPAEPAVQSPRAAPAEDGPVAAEPRAAGLKRKPELIPDWFAHLTKKPKALPPYLRGLCKRSRTMDPVLQTLFSFGEAEGTSSSSTTGSSSAERSHSPTKVSEVPAPSGSPPSGSLPLRARRQVPPCPPPPSRVPQDAVASKIIQPVVANCLGARAGWSYLLADQRRQCFAAHMPRALDAEVSQRLMQEARRSEWLQPSGRLGLIPRKTLWLVREPCTCHYLYGGLQVEPRPFPRWVQEAMEICMPLCGLSDPKSWPNSCNLNLYVDGGMSVGWHSDDERLFQGKFSDCRIVSLSLGTRRKFEMRLNWPEEGERQSWQVFLGDGDLLTMEGMMQKHFQHRVPREDNVTAPRINLTWRWVARHAPRCPVERPRRS
uniref:Fe2OG dioxygenase domain-containing protein n=1 Tax=Alexandrium monilatum TaxID=311494 RepID=A0A7S4S7P7_9DINO